MNNAKRMMLYAVLDAILCYKRDGSEAEFLYTDELGEYLKTWELEVTEDSVRQLVDLDPYEIRDKMKLILEVS